MKKTFGAKLADNIANFVGSWPFIIIQSILLIIWVVLNVLKVVGFDPYPFILLNLFLSFQAAYATPMILMSGNRRADKDRKQAALDLKIDSDTNKVIKMLAEDIKLDRQKIDDHKISKEQHLILLKKVDELIEKVNLINRPTTNY